MRATVTVDTRSAAGRRLLAPVGIATPHETPLSFGVDGADFALTGETSTGQMAAAIRPEGGQPVTLTYETTIPGSAYPESLFVYRSNRFTRVEPAAIAIQMEIDVEEAIAEVR